MQSLEDEDKSKEINFGLLTQQNMNGRRESVSGSSSGSKTRQEIGKEMSYRHSKPRDPCNVTKQETMDFIHCRMQYSQEERNHVGHHVNKCARQKEDECEVEEEQKLVEAAGSQLQ